MRVGTVRTHLRPYSIYQKRKTTINHAFASALAPSSDYDWSILSDALAILGQSADKDLTCVYCTRPAETWDHLTGLVKNSLLHGYGHQIGNLVPSCRDCNSRKGNKAWRSFVEQEIAEPLRSPVLGRLEAYQVRFAVEVDLAEARTRATATWQRYDAIRAEIHDLMLEADRLAIILRHCVKEPRQCPPPSRGQ